MTIGFVSIADPFHDRVAWSGTVYKLREAIEKTNFEVKWIPYGNRRSGKFWLFLLYYWNRTIGRSHKWMSETYFRPIAKSWAKEVESNPIFMDCDFLFFPGYAHIALYTKIKKPYIFLSDATASLMFDYYWFKINEVSKKMSLDIDMKAAHEATINIRSSQWAVNSLINDYHCEPYKCHVLEFGPNIDTKDIKKSCSYIEGPLFLLFSGINWTRKGGDIAVEVVEVLRRRKVDARLIVVGPKYKPDSCKDKPFIEFEGYLNKNNEKDYEKYINLYQKAHIFLLPTKAECSAIVYSEAAAAGLPTYTYRIGGSGNYVVNKVNGYALPEGSSANDFADMIIVDLQTGRMSLYREGASKLFKEKLCWEAWSKSFADIVLSVG